MDLTGLKDKVTARLAELGVRIPSTAGVVVMGDSESMTTELAALIMIGRKTATSSLVWEYEWEGSPLPHEGEENVLADLGGTPFALLRTTSVEIVPFEQVGPDFAAAEGEGDRTLESWRREHWDFFSRVCRRIGRAPVQSMPIVCERFQVATRF